MASKAPQPIVPNPSWIAGQKTAWDRVQKALPIALGYLGTEIPVLDNHTDAMLVDEVGILKQAHKVFKDAEAAHVERLKARMGQTVKMEGDSYYAEYTGGSRTILNQGACKELIAKAEELDIHLLRLLAAIESGQINVPNNVFLKEGHVSDEVANVEFQDNETNNTDFFSTSPGGALYVKPY